MLRRLRGSRSASKAWQEARLEEKSQRGSWRRWELIPRLNQSDASNIRARVGISFGGVVALILADLIVLPILDIYRRYYGMKMTLFILLTFYFSMSVAACLDHHSLVRWELVRDLEIRIRSRAHPGHTR